MQKLNNTALTIPCAIGTLEARLLYTDEASSCGVIICPPHPLLAGNMDNNVVQTLAKTLARNFPVLVFNYRTVGKSSNPEPDLPLFEYWDRLDRTDDFSAIIEDTQKVLSWSSRLFARHHLVGYSFGAYIAQKIAQKTTTQTVTAITPPLHDHDFSPMTELNMPTTIILAENDDLIKTDMARPPAHTHTVLTIAGTDHFFRSKEQLLARQIAKALCAFSQSPCST
jgi:alpha/beta superfamily hydrolase